MAVESRDVLSDATVTDYIEVWNNVFTQFENDGHRDNYTDIEAEKY